MTNCVNCGAILHGNKCEYCGTEYNGNNIVVNFESMNTYGNITIGDKTYKVYLGETVIHPIGYGGCLIDGTMLKPLEYKRTFELIEA